jgi:hypothetical protein
MTRTALALFAALGFTACSTHHDPAGGNGVGRVHAAITAVPPNTFCVRVVAGSSAKAVDVTPGATSSVDLDNIPVGLVNFAGFAYGQACAGVTEASQPSYASAPTPAAVQPGQVTTLELTLEPVGGAQVGINFGDGGVPPDMAYTPDLAGGGLPTPNKLVAQPDNLTVTPFAGAGATIWLTNVGDQVTSRIDFAVPYPFSLLSTTCPDRLNGHAACSLTIGALTAGPASTQIEVFTADYAIWIPITQ